MFTLVEVGLTIASLLVAVVAYYKWSFTYWKRRGVPHITPTKLGGNIDGFFRRKIPSTIQLANFYHWLRKNNHRYGGFYVLTTPRFVLADPSLVKAVLSKDFQSFVDRGIYYNEKDDPLSAHLFAIGGEKWRNLRSRLTPTFTSGKMKMMFPTMVACADPLKQKIDSLVATNSPLDIKELVACFTTDVIGSCAFGVECNSLKDPEAEFRKYGRLIFGGNIVKNMFVVAFPNLCRKLGVKQNRNDVNEFFMNMVKSTVDYRESNSVTRKDFLQLLIDLKSSFTMDEISAQAFVFFIAGFETSSTGMTFCMYELAYHQDIQDKVRKEINEKLSKHAGEITYESLAEMKYLEQVINEAMRMYPPLPLHIRVCTQEYKVPDSDVVIEKGNSILIPCYGLHHDPEYYPEPEKFDPERFSEENKGSIVPFTYLPFGDGPRICIGARFGMMQMKIGLISILHKHRLVPHSSTPKTMTFDPKQFILTPKETLYLTAEPIGRT